MIDLNDHFFTTGLKRAFIALIVAIILAIFDFNILTFLFFAASVVLLFLYRKPQRYFVEVGQEGVVSPVDGTVIKIEKSRGDHYKIVIKSTLLQSGAYYAIAEAKIERIKLQRGARLPEYPLLFKKLNEKIKIDFAVGERIVSIEQILKRSFCDIECFVKEKQEIKEGEKIGFVCNALTTVYLPANTRLETHMGAILRASESVLGYFADEEK